MTNQESKISNQLQELWVEFGKLSAQREISLLQLQQMDKQRQQIYSQIQKLRKNEAKNEGKE